MPGRKRDISTNEQPHAGAFSANLSRRSGRARPFGAFGRDKSIAENAGDMVHNSYTSYMARVNAFLRVLNTYAEHLPLSRRHDLAEQFAASCDPIKPMKWAVKPEGESFQTFIAREYRNRGLVAAGVTAADVGRYDPKFEEVYRNMLRAGKVPEDCQFAKAGPMAKVGPERQAGIDKLMM